MNSEGSGLKKISICMITGIFLLCAGCSQKQNAPAEEMTSETESIQELTELESESIEETQPPTNAPFPEENPNGVTFTNGKYDFIEVLLDDEYCADGELSVENIDGNFMLKFTDQSTNPENLGTLVQKFRVHVNHLLRPDQLESVYAISFDIGAQAKGDYFVNEEGKRLYVPGWIGGGGGTNCADDKWYGFADFSAVNINEFALERSDLYHVEFKFLLADSGKKWTADMEDPNFIIMRWGVQNLSDLYLDNIIFYDQEGNAIPVNYLE